LGWIDGVNIRMDIRYGGSDYSLLRLHAEELVRSVPNVIVVSSGPTQRAVLHQTQTIPIVMAAGGDPVVMGVLESIARPAGNITGFAALVPSIGSKWVALLKEIAPWLCRIALLYPAYPEGDPDFASATYFPSIEAAATQLGMQAIRTPVRDASEIERAIDAFAAEPNGGLIMVPPPLISTDREAVIRLAAQHRLPAIYFRRSEGVDGGLMSYGSNVADLHRKAASYVDRILRGAKPTDLPIQFPTRYELVINVKTAGALGLQVPPQLTALADEVIE
jgi:putative ABC transport system substrate-binding protein